jgi:hypothetical protein
VRSAPHHASFAAALAGLLAERGDARSAAELFGLTGLGFRLTVAPRVDLSGWAAFPWAQELPPAVGRLGYPVEVVHAEPGHPLYAQAHRRALELCRRGPVIAWGVQLPAFGLVRASPDPSTLEISGPLDGRGGAQTMAAEALGGGDVPVLFVLALGERQPVDAQAALLDALHEALRLHFAAFAPAGYQAGQGAWEAWREALASGHLDPAGHAFAAQLAAEARRHAADFLASAQLSGADLGLAADAYARGAAALAELAERFPFPPRRPLDNAQLTDAVELLGRAAASESRGLAAIEAALAAHTRAAAAERYVIEEAVPADLHRCLVDLPIGGLEPAARECARQVAPRLGQSFLAWVARNRHTGAVVGHVYAAALADSGYPIAAEGRQLFLFCPWVLAPLRRRGIGRQLFAALRAQAAARGFDGILTEASTLPIFLHEAPLLAQGFSEVARRGDQRLLHLALGDVAPLARWLSVESEEAAERVTVRHVYNCPLLLATRHAAAEVARQERLPVDERDAGGAEAGVVAFGERLPNLPAAPDVLLQALRAHRRDPTRG